MANYEQSLNVSALHNVVRKQKTVSGEMIDVMIIPLEKNQMKKDKNGNWRLNLINWENREVQEWGGTHSTKQSFSKEYREGLTDEEKKELPYLGHLKPMVLDAQNRQSEEDSGKNEGDDLPF